MANDIRLGQLHQLALGATDLQRSVAFYRDQLGLHLFAEFDPPGLAFFELGDTRLLLEHAEEPSPGHSVLYLRVSDLDAAYRTLRERGVAFTSEPHLIHRDEDGTFGPAGSEEWMAFLDDPDGNHLALAARVLPG